MAIGNVLRTRLKFEMINAIDDYLDKNPQIVQQYRAGQLDQGLRAQAAAEEKRPTAPAPPPAQAGPTTTQTPTVAPVEPGQSAKPTGSAQPAAVPEPAAIPTDDADLVSDEDLEAIIAEEARAAISKASDEELGIGGVVADTNPSDEAMRLTDEIVGDISGSGPTEDQVAKLAEYNVALRAEYFED